MCEKKMEICYHWKRKKSRKNGLEEKSKHNKKYQTLNVYDRKWNGAHDTIQFERKIFFGCRIISTLLNYLHSTVRKVKSYKQVAEFSTLEQFSHWKIEQRELWYVCIEIGWKIHFSKRLLVLPFPAFPLALYLLFIAPLRIVVWRTTSVAICSAVKHCMWNIHIRQWHTYI